MLTITPIPALDSNYFWVIQPKDTAELAYVVDPGDATPVMEYLTLHKLRLGGILITHRHRDHIQGVDELVKHWPVPVYGPKSEHIPQITHIVKEGDVVDLDGLLLKVIEVPGHTWEHIAYFGDSPSRSAPILFCGDALFAGGCGRRFDGTAEIMWNSLQALAALPETTQIYCAHEYTEANLAFAVEVEPNNQALKTRFAQVKLARAQGQITLPSNILLEKRTNPFLRCQQTGIKIFAERETLKQLDNAAEVFGALRSIKDSWPK